MTRRTYLKMRLSILLLAFVFLRDGISQTTEFPTVQTKVGAIRGLRATDGEYNKFTGIPYARVNEKNPFGFHIPQPPFQTVFDATKTPVMCYQSAVTEMAVDCLQLNIYVPNNINSTDPLPVLLYIHGGGYDVGWSGQFGPKFLVKHNVILVTINYRLGPYGYMCLDIPEVPGNQGLRDATAAIKWVKENIEAFGGDGNKITIMGESAGAFMVDFLLRFSEPNLFQKAIMLSGAAGRYRAPTKPDYNFAIKLAEKLGFYANSSLEAITFLADADPKAIITNYGTFDGVGPCVEKNFPSVPAFVTENPESTSMPNVKTTSILIGYNDAELGFFKQIYPLVYTDEYIPDILTSLEIFDDEQELATILRRFYMGDSPNFNVQSDDSTQFSYFNDDYMFTHPVERAIDAYFKNGASNVYRFMFTYSGARNWMKLFVNLQGDGAVHGDFLGYLFDMDILLGQEINKEDQLKIDEVTTMWTNFVKYGNPTPETSDLLPLNWPKIEPGSSYYLNIGKELVVGKRPFQERMAFWDLVHIVNDNLKRNK